MMDIITLMENVEWIGSGNIREWCDEDPIHYTLLLEAMLMEKIDYEYETDVLDEFYQQYPEYEFADSCPVTPVLPPPSPFIDGLPPPPFLYPSSNFGRSSLAIRKELEWMLARGGFNFRAKVFKQWYNSIWPPEDTVESHMSIDLAIAIRCSRDSYSGGVADGFKHKQEIENWLKDNHPEIISNNRRYERIMLIVNRNPQR